MNRLQNSGTPDGCHSLPTAYEGLRRELQWLDALLDLEIRRFRAAHAMPMDEFRGLYVSDEQVDALLRKQSSDAHSTGPHSAALDAGPLRSAIHAALRRDSPLSRLGELFELEEFERNVLLLAVAPELDLRYEIVCSYLNNDVTRKRPNCDLALRLFAADIDDRWARRRHFAVNAPLFRHGLLQWVAATPEVPASILARAFAAPPRVVEYLLGNETYREPRLAPFARIFSPRSGWDDLALPAEFTAQLRGVRRLLEEPRGPVLVFIGNEGAGKETAAEALSRELHKKLMVADVEAIMAGSDDTAELASLFDREQRLCNALLFLTHAEALFDAERRLLPRGRGLIRALGFSGQPVVVGADPAFEFAALRIGLRAHVLHFPVPPFSMRRRLWQRELMATFGAVDGADVDALANRFALNAGQIHDAVQFARDRVRVHGASHAAVNTDLFAGARAQSQPRLRSLTQQIEPLYSWKDLVLPDAVLQQLREIESALKIRHVVMDDWGFEKRMSLGRGMKALFAGSSGTGKTMTAEVLAHELELDLYKVDLSGIVSKYIGETEKNLDRIFAAARSSNAILFFDEADALFGKRSEVSDAHDRYANIEVAYLLQKTEEYDGFVILATNLAQNIDEAFKRRMNYTVDFPFPDEFQRERLWRMMFPPQTPVADDLEFTFLARQFALSGGNIKSAALAAAFLAAADGGKVRMEHLIKAVAREWQKLGKLPSTSEFQHHYEHIRAQLTAGLA